MPLPRRYVLALKNGRGRKVFLGEAEWRGHILDKHPEVGGFLEHVTQAVTSPDFWHTDPEDPRVELHYREVPLADRPHPKLRYLLVVIKYVPAPERDLGSTGFISSVYFLKQPKRRGVAP